MTLLSKRKPAPRAVTQPVSRTVSVPAPIRGLNSQDSIAAMKPTDALRLDNLVCRPGYLEVRKGWQPYALDIDDPVETLLPYVAVDGSKELFAIAGDSLYEVTAAGAVSAALLTGLTNAYWNFTQTSNQAGNHLIAANGADDAQIYSGSTWGDLGITGLAINTVTQIGVWKRRLWFVEKDSMSAWYGAVDAIAGAVTEFSFAGVFRRGGKLKAILNWTIDGGAGLDDYLLAITSEGEVAAYKGTDPASASTFGLAGVYQLGAPIGERFHCQYGGDVILLTRDGLVSLSKFFQSQGIRRDGFYSSRIQNLLLEELTAYGDVQGWEVHIFFPQNLLFIQVPGGEIGYRYQYACSLLTGAWSKLLYKEAITWAPQDDQLWQGQDGQTALAWNTNTDNGEAIQYVVIPAFSDFGHPTAQKQFLLGRVAYQSDQPPTKAYVSLINYETRFAVPSLGSAPLVGSFWDVALWDQAVWGGDILVHIDTYSLNNLGLTGSVALTGLSRGEVTRILSFDYTFQLGSLL